MFDHFLTVLLEVVIMLDVLGAVVYFVLRALVFSPSPEATNKAISRGKLRGTRGWEYVLRTTGESVQPRSSIKRRISRLLFFWRTRRVVGSVEKEYDRVWKVLNSFREKPA